MNKKGFTLVELLATLVVLSLVLGISIFGIFSTLENAKKKTEREFLTQLSNSVETWINLCLSEMASDEDKKCKGLVNNYWPSPLKTISKTYGNVNVYASKSTFNSFVWIIREGILSRNDLINPINSEDCYSAKIKTYRDADEVYYYRIELPENCVKYNDYIIDTLPQENGNGGDEVNPNGGGKPNENSLIEQEDAIIPNDEIDSGNYEEYVGGKSKDNNNLEESNDNLEGEEVIISEGRVAQERERVENTQ